MNSKLVKTLGVAGIISGSYLCLKSMTDDGKYEDKFIKSGKEIQIYANHRGHFYDKNNTYEFLGGLALALTGLALTGNKKSYSPSQ